MLSLLYLNHADTVDAGHPLGLDRLGRPAVVVVARLAALRVAVLAPLGRAREVDAAVVREEEGVTAVVAHGHLRDLGGAGHGHLVPPAGRARLLVADGRRFARVEELALCGDHEGKVCAGPQVGRLLAVAADGKVDGVVGAGGGRGGGVDGGGAEDVHALPRQLQRQILQNVNGLGQ